MPSFNRMRQLTNKLRVFNFARSRGYNVEICEGHAMLVKHFSGGNHAIVYALFTEKDAFMAPPISMLDACAWELQDLSFEPIEGGERNSLSTTFDAIEAAQIRNLEARADRSMGLAYFMPQAE